LTRQSGRLPLNIGRSGALGERDRDDRAASVLKKSASFHRVRNFRPMPA